MDKLHDLTALNQNIAYSMGKSVPTLSDLCTMEKFILCAEMLFLTMFNPGEKLDNRSALWNAPAQLSVFMLADLSVS